jgi:galactonate dehydratase
MKITALKTFTAWSPFTDWSFLKVETDDPEIFGWGECSLPSKPHGVAGALKDLEPLLLGADPLDREWCWQRMYRHSYWRGGPILTSSISAVDMALWDIAGKIHDTPVYKLMGGAVRDRIKLYANIGLSTSAAELRNRARHAVGLGYAVVKFYPLPPLGSVEGPAVVRQVADCCAAVRDEIGPDRDFALDFHGKTSAAMAVQIERAVRDTHPLWIEEPVLPETPNALVRCAEKFVTPIALGERLFTRWGFRPVLEGELASIIQPDVANAGGISEMIRIAALAELYGVTFNPHSPNSPLQSMASMHIAANAQMFGMLEHRHEHHDYMARLCSHVPTVEADGCAGLPAGAGLGTSVNEGFFADQVERPFIPEEWRKDGSIAEW